MGDWIKSLERMPSPYVAVLGWSMEDKQYLIVAVSRETGKWFDQTFQDREDITHWCVVPEPPTGDLT